MIKDGETVFHLAVFYNRLDMMKTLLSLGADRNCKDSVSCHGNLFAHMLNQKYINKTTPIKKTEAPKNRPNELELHTAISGNSFCLLLVSFKLVHHSKQTKNYNIQKHTKRT